MQRFLDNGASCWAPVVKLLSHLVVVKGKFVLIGAQLSSIAESWCSFQQLACVSVGEDVRGGGNRAGRASHELGGP